MLQAINDRIKGWLGIVIVILIGLPFALWGIQSYLDDSGPQYAAKVNDTKISTNEFERSVSLQRQSMLRQFGGTLPFEEKELRERTMNQLINQRLLESVTYENGYRISDPVIAARIKQQFTVDGEFDRVRFETGVASLGMSIPMYEALLRNELRVDQLQTAIANSAFVTKKELNDMASLSEQTRDISVLTFDAEHFATEYKPTEDEIKNYYQTNLRRYMVPEKVKVDYVEVTSDSLAENIEVDESQVQKMYDDYVASVSGREERKARHILILTAEDKAAAMEKIQKLKTEIDNGADFSTLAKENSQDPVSAAEGGDLGWIELGEMARPFEQALFDMELPVKGKGVVSDVVETQFGLHLIKLEDIRSEAIEPKSVKRYQFEDELRAEAAASMFYDLSERLATIAYENPDSLDVVVEELGLKVNTSSSFSRSKGEGLFADENVRSVAFSPLVLEQNSNSDVIEISPNHVIVLRINEHTPEIAMPLEVVRSKIEAVLVTQNSYQKVRQAALELKARVEAGEDVKSIASEGVNIEVINDLGRMDTEKVSTPSIVHNAFEIVPGEGGVTSAKVVDLVSGGIALVVLNKINAPGEISPDKLNLVKNSMVRENANIDFSNVLSAMKNKATIDRNKRVLEK